MTRTIPQGIKDVLDAKELKPFFGVQMLLDTENLYFWTGLGDLTVGNVTYLGTGQFLQIGEMQETAEIAARGATVTLSGIPSNLISLAISEPYQGRIAKIMFGAVDANKIYLIDEAGDYILREDGGLIDISEGDSTPVVEVFSGYIDQMNIEEGADTSSILINIESRLIDLERARVFRYTDGSQKTRYPNDKGLEFVEDLQDKQFNWGRG